MSNLETMTEREFYAQQEEPRACDLCISIGPLKVCKKCHLEFCPHFASKFDFQFCIYCMHDVILEDSIIRKEIVTKSLSGKKTFTRVMKARHLVFKGQDWMFAAKRILDMSDEELGVTIEYHREIFGEMINEMETRKIANNKKAINKMMRNSTLKIPTVRGMNTDGTIIGMESQVITETTVKRTRITATQTNSTQVALAGIIAVFKAQGLSGEQIKAKLMSMAGK